MQLRDAVKTSAQGEEGAELRPPASSEGELLSQLRAPHSSALTQAAWPVEPGVEPRHGAQRAELALAPQVQGHSEAQGLEGRAQVTHQLRQRRVVAGRVQQHHVPIAYRTWPACDWLCSVCLEPLTSSQRPPAGSFSHSLTSASRRQGEVTFQVRPPAPPCRRPRDSSTVTVTRRCILSSASKK
ncbi:hypothetical protein EYF80_041531 [Liparis tanakae]|uniref:Uncharacterized protein n=1 Tax=Liparis tanakae TaxID=230148 RepID=A0A4Z2G4T7_9TELE|nr:hypothetical protein EYF80_041531 [Liparis tanakae]